MLYITGRSLLRLKRSSIVLQSFRPSKRKLTCIDYAFTFILPKLIEQFAMTYHFLMQIYLFQLYYDTNRIREIQLPKINIVSDMDAKINKK